MKRETVIAIVMGIVFGISVGLFLLLKTKKEEQTKIIPVTTAVRATPVNAKSATSEQSFVLSEPEDNSITDKNKITIKGKAAKDSLLIIQSPIKNIVMKLDNDNFSQDFPLALGENVIHISVYPKDSKEASQDKTLTIYQLQEK